MFFIWGMADNLVDIFTCFSNHLVHALKWEI